MINRRKTATWVAAAAIGAGVLFGTSACNNKATEQFQDAPISVRDHSAVEVYDDADGFSNWAEKCDRHGNRVFIAFHNNNPYTAVAVVKDPTCPTG